MTNLRIRFFARYQLRHWWRQVACLFALLPIAQAAPPRAILKLGLADNQGFCTQDYSKWPFGLPAGLSAWISLCNNGAEVKPVAAHAVTQSFSAPAFLSLYLTGFTKRDHLSLRLENLASGISLSLNPAGTPGGGWERFDFAIPSSWRGKPVRLSAVTADADPDGWIGFSEPVMPLASRGFKAMARLLLRVSEYFLLLSLIFFAGCLAALRRGVRNIYVIGLIGFVAITAAGYVAFWLWFLSPRVGHAYSFVIHLAGAGYLLWFGRSQFRGESRMRLLLLPWLLTFVITLFILSAGFLYGGLDQPLVSAQTRFSYALPSDNYLPFLFAEQISQNHIARPIFIDWLSSDRPPLQTGMALLEYPFTISPRNLGYQVVAVFLQGLWVLALWIFAEAFSVPRRVTVWIITAVLFSGFTFVNSFFVWPKLFAAACMLGAATLVLSPEIAALEQARLGPAILAGALGAFSFLAHGGSAFACLGLLLTLLIIRSPRVRLPKLMLSGLCFLVLYSPWIFYQKFYDPPGDRLLKMHLAGVAAPTSKSFPTVFVSAYRNLTWQQIIRNREANLSTVFDHQGNYAQALVSFLENAAHDLEQGGGAAAPMGEWISGLQFRYFLVSLGLLMIGPVFLLGGLSRQRRTLLWRVAAVTWLYVACTLFVWCMLMFNPESTVIHQGTYVANLLAIAGSVLAIWSVSRSFAIILILVQSLLNFVVYVVYSKGIPSPGTLGEGILDSGELLLLIASLAFFCILLLRMAREDRANGVSADAVLPLYDISQG